MNRSRRGLWPCLIALALSSCTMAVPTNRKATSPTTPATTTTTTVPVQPGWTPVTTGPNGVITDQRNVAMANGREITVVRFRVGQIRFNLHIGSQEPPVGTAALGPQAMSLISASERPILVAAFNGGFKVNAAAGGVEVDGQTLTPLLSGMASLVIDVNGSAHIGVWGSSVPVPGEQVSSVRQNLRPLVTNGQISPYVGSLVNWGYTLNGVAAPPRSSLGEDAAGDILYAASSSALPIDLATALVGDGATNAMELDINPETVQLDLAAVPGGPLVAGVPGQNRPANQYLVGWTRDFIAVLESG